MNKFSTTIFRALFAVAVTAGLVIGSAGAAAAEPDVGPVGPSLRTPSFTGGTWDGVRCIQIALGLHADGLYGQETFDAVQDFQARNGIVVDGVVGPITGDLILLSIGYSEGFHHCYQYLPTTYSLDPNDGAIGEGGNPIECAFKQANAVRSDLVKIFTGDTNAKHVVRASAGRGFSTAIGLVKCTFVG